MSSRPFFSVIIPTKNRPELVKDAIWSVRRQSFADIELVVLDNSDEGFSARSAVPTGDPRIRYVRTGDLTMPDNWERAYEEARGEYISILPDRRIWSSAKLLERVYSEISCADTRVVTWKTADIVNGHQSRAATGLWQRYSCQDVLDAFAGMDWRLFSDVAPRGLNSFVHRDTVSAVRERAGRVCPPLSPDYTSATSILLVSERLSHFNGIAAYAQSLGASNGHRALATFQDCTDAILGLGAASIEESYDHVPIKLPTVKNSVVNDFLRVLDAWQCGATFSDCNVHGYFDLIKGDLLSFSPAVDHADLYRRFNTAAIKFAYPELRVPGGGFGGRSFARALRSAAQVSPLRMMKPRRPHDRRVLPRITDARAFVLEKEQEVFGDHWAASRKIRHVIRG
jgi:hypothetical protein